MYIVNGDLPHQEHDEHQEKLLAKNDQEKLPHQGDDQELLLAKKITAP